MSVAFNLAMEPEDHIAANVTDAIMGRLERGEERALSNIINDEVRQVLRQARREVGWSEWATKSPRDAFLFGLCIGGIIVTLLALFLRHY